MTMQVVRVDWVGAYTDGEVVRVEVEGQQLTVPVGDVIELTEEPGPPIEMRDHNEGASRRWVSDWVAVDGD